MGFSGIGIWEILVILIVALIVLGPNRIPEIARTLGKAVRAIRKASTDLTTTVTRELEAEKKEPPPKEAGQDKTPASSTGATASDQNHQSAKPGGASPAK